MRALLERWHAHESDRCRIGPPTSQMCADVKVGDDVYLVMLDRPSPKQLGLLLAAVIEAIDARSWMWGVGVVTSQPRIWAYVRRDRWSAGNSGKSDTPAAALLTAYLAALEVDRAA